jgi:hypothetical protein
VVEEELNNFSCMFLVARFMFLVNFVLLFMKKNAHDRNSIGLNSRFPNFLLHWKYKLKCLG